MTGETKSGAQKGCSYGLGASGLQGPGSTPYSTLLYSSFSLQFVCVSFMLDKGRRLSRPCELTFIGKAVPLRAWTVPEGSGRLRLPDLKTVST
jgi:hypothetical protein